MLNAHLQSNTKSQSREESKNVEKTISAGPFQVFHDDTSGPPKSELAKKIIDVTKRN